MKVHYIRQLYINHMIKNCVQGIFIKDKKQKHSFNFFFAHRKNDRYLLFEYLMQFDKVFIFCNLSKLLTAY